MAEVIVSGALSLFLSLDEQRKKEKKLWTDKEREKENKCLIVGVCRVFFGSIIMENLARPDLSLGEGFLRPAGAGLGMTLAKG